MKSCSGQPLWNFWNPLHMLPLNLVKVWIPLCTNRQFEFVPFHSFLFILWHACHNLLVFCTLRWDLQVLRFIHIEKLYILTIFTSLTYYNPIPITNCLQLCFSNIVLFWFSLNFHFILYLNVCISGLSLAGKKRENPEGKSWGLHMGFLHVSKDPDKCRILKSTLWILHCVQPPEAHIIDLHLRWAFGEIKQNELLVRQPQIWVLYLNIRGESVLLFCLRPIKLDNL